MKRSFKHGEYMCFVVQSPAWALISPFLFALAATKYKIQLKYVNTKYCSLRAFPRNVKKKGPPATELHSARVNAIKKWCVFCQGVMCRESFFESCRVILLVVL